MADDETPPLRKRLGWLVLIWAASVLAVAIVAYGLRLWIM